MLTINFLLLRKVVFSIFDYLENTIVEAPLDLKTALKHKRTPESGKLFSVNENLLLICKEKTELFHQFVTRLLFASKLAQHDIQVTVTFLFHQNEETNGVI